MHNRFVEGLKRRGAIFVEELSEVPDDNIVIFSAFTVFLKDEQEGVGGGLYMPIIGAKVHMEVARASLLAYGSGSDWSRGSPLK